MNLHLIRVIDRWVGIPACFFLSLGRRLVKRFQSDAKPRSGKGKLPVKFLFIELSEMGSAILAYPAMRYVLSQYPGAKLYFLTFRQNRFSVDVLDVIPRGRVITIDVEGPLRFIITTFKALKAIREENIDVVFDMELFSRFSSLISGLSGIGVRAGYGKYHEEGLYRGSFMTHKVFYNCHQHMVKNFLALVKAIERQGEHPLVKEKISGKDLVRPCYKSSEKDLEILRKRLADINPVALSTKHLVLFNPSAGELLPIRAWPVENYVRLAEKIVERFDVAVILLGLKEASHAAATILDQVGPEQCIDFTGHSSFKDLMDLLNLADVLVTPDSGPAHFAVLTPIKNIVLFGPETPELYAPFGPNTTCFFAGLSCSPCLSAYNHRNTSCTDPKCMKAITVNEVFDTVSASLNGM